ncbi:MAG: hypothetical protein OXH09_20315 [Gammaproteobacteria bacterium]|nr:hypothetical protein [Gammaproteobacteria bacterium]
MRGEFGGYGLVDAAEELGDAVALMVAVRRAMTVRVLTSGPANRDVGKVPRSLAPGCLLSTRPVLGERAECALASFHAIVTV